MHYSDLLRLRLFLFEWLHSSHIQMNCVCGHWSAQSEHKLPRFMTILIQFTLTCELQWRRINLAGNKSAIYLVRPINFLFSFFLFISCFFSFNSCNLKWIETIRWKGVNLRKLKFHISFQRNQQNQQQQKKNIPFM